MATILVVEERPINRRFLVTLLQERGHRLLEAADGEEALRIARAEKPDAVIIDLLTPKMDACRFATQLEGEHERPRLIFRAPSSVEPEGRMVAKAFGASFLLRPANPEVLLAVVGAALAKTEPV